ncbi:uncharacterized protein DS421_1g16300 [Arachis hypogaea]|nr:uncharacterized protein DS421_1g16300 [Arachis hypogaea]
MTHGEEGRNPSRRRRHELNSELRATARRGGTMRRGPSRASPDDGTHGLSPPAATAASTGGEEYSTTTLKRDEGENEKMSS